jgi:hypothetical protein
MEEPKFTWGSGGICDIVDIAGGHEEPMTYVNCFDIIICHWTLLWIRGIFQCYIIMIDFSMLQTASLNAGIYELFRSYN